MDEKQLHTILENIGLSRKEAKIYLALLDYPESTLADIVRKTRMPRMTCHSILEKLFTGGFIDIIIKRKRKFFIVIPPKQLLDRLSQQLQEFRDALPRLEKHHRILRDMPRVHYFNGKEGLRLIFWRLLQEQRPFVVITEIEDMEKIAPEYFHDFIDQRVAKRIPVKMLTNRTLSSLKMKERDMQEFRQTRFMPHNYEFHTATYVSGNLVAIISLRRNPPTALIIEDSDVAKTYRMYFDLIWEQTEIR